MIQMMLTASLAMLTACSADSIDDYYNNWNNGGGPNMGGGAGGATAGSGELVSFDINIDKSTAEPATTVAASYPEATDDISLHTCPDDFRAYLSNFR